MEDAAADNNQRGEDGNQNKRQRVQQEDDPERNETDEIKCDGAGWPTFPSGHQVIPRQTLARQSMDEMCAR
jgi:hypothetical protein